MRKTGSLALKAVYLHAKHLKLFFLRSSNDEISPQYSTSSDTKLYELMSKFYEISIWRLSPNWAFLTGTNFYLETQSTK